MESTPLFIIGAPRSGTTFLCTVLNQHPLIQITNENRVFVLLKDMLEVGARRPDFLAPENRGHFQAYGRRTLGDWVEGFYREGLGMTAPIWGDKHPPYADPTVLSGRTGSTPYMPRSGSCLRLIRELLPKARFIHIHRDPGEVAASLVRKAWIDSIEDGMRVWGEYVSEILEFLYEIPENSYLALPYDGLIGSIDHTVDNIGRFLALDDTTPIREFLSAQHHTPTPVSDPAADFADRYRQRLSTPTRPYDRRLLALAGNAAATLGYAAA